MLEQQLNSESSVVVGQVWGDGQGFSGQEWSWLPSRWSGFAALLEEHCFKDHISSYLCTTRTQNCFLENVKCDDHSKCYACSEGIFCRLPTSTCCLLHSMRTPQVVWASTAIGTVQNHVLDLLRKGAKVSLKVKLGLLQTSLLWSLMHSWRTTTTYWIYSINQSTISASPARYRFFIQFVLY